jgi:hypothetical protein
VQPAHQVDWHEWVQSRGANDIYAGQVPLCALMACVINARVPACHILHCFDGPFQLTNMHLFVAAVPQADARKCDTADGPLAGAPARKRRAAPADA